MGRPEFATALDLLESVSHCEQYGARFVSRTEEAAFYPYTQIVDRAAKAAGYLQQKGIRPGDRIAMVLPTSIRFFDAYLGTILAGAIPAALYPPFQLGKLAEYFARTRNLLSKIGARALITDGRVGKILGPVVAGVECLEDALRAEDLEQGGKWTPVESGPDQPAFLQFSSGTTQNPKAVVITHRNLLCNLRMMAAVMGMVKDPRPEDGGVCWLPLYHDMGLVGFLFNGLHYPATITYLNPEDFIAKPSLWFRTISRYRAQVSAAPHFAYRLCAAKVPDAEMEGVDLSCWHLALNGAEPIDVEGMRSFTERFSRWGLRREAMTPAYGLAEAGLAVSFSSLDRCAAVTSFDRSALALEHRAVEGEGRDLPSLGTPMPGLEVEIRDEDDRPLGPGCVGKIVVRGPSVSPGYWEDEEATRAAIRAGGWLETGDLGFFHNSELHIVGRAKELVIIRGRNYAPQEIEELLLGMPGIRSGHAVAVGHFVEGKGEELIIFAERAPEEQLPEATLAARIRERIVRGISLNPYLIQILEPGTLPRTSSGKLQRSETLRMFLAGELVPPEKVSSLMLLKELGKSQLAWGRFRIRARS
ncbi:MAG: fatty acyl-AMP ligase [Bryobacteraceae bacterium]